ncbi:uncharacterized protein B0H18DRAFT_964909 [Fomitopsis serialis]|uniref:uncharacterized protein n=1 Tax=Fomitopsis serialis TaxID=139415 RepID=UPI0020089194|nr:uncharacterized protein B0H18DRAFT_964909 [Neoantrodia serialis]KAH9905103.1 hypothetical protein B0H18DRAFT_964909 [Neoantrodia serialis]
MSRRIIQAGVKPRAKVMRTRVTETRRGNDIHWCPQVDDIPNFDFGDPANAHLLPGHARKRAKTRLAGSTQADFMREWLPHREDFLERLIDLEAPRERRRVLVTEHKRDFLHRVERWISEDGPLPADPEVQEPDEASEWEDVESDLFPAEPSRQQGPVLGECVDVTGVHHVRVTFCQCSKPDSKPRQLLALGLYPASVLAPRTAFTFRVLDDFLLANKISGIAAQSYFERLRRLTSNAFPARVPDRYRELLRTSRQWRNLKYRKWHGYGHGRGPVGPGDLALGCVACPRPGVNLKDGWDREANQWKYTQSFVMDGNFSAEHLKMRSPKEDVSLADGHGFMVTEEPYKCHLKEAVEVREKSSCHAHRAVNQANADHHDMEATGIGAVACARHGCFVPHAVVDFQKGERQMNMDYALSQAFQFYAGLQTFILMYDIACFEAFDVAANGLIFWGIGLFHIHGHQRDCLPKFSPDFIPGAGNVDGEIIETLWSPLNRISGSTRAMSTSHRKEVIDDHMNDSNWRKTATQQKLAYAETLRNLEVSSDPVRLAEWRGYEAKARAERVVDLRVMEVYEVTQEKAPGKRDIQLALEKEEGRRKEQSGLASWLAEGVSLQEQQLAVASLARRHAKDALLTSQIQLVSRRNRLQKAVDRFAARSSAFLEEEQADKDGTEADERANGVGTSYGGEEWEDIDDDPDVTDEIVVAEEADDVIHPETVPLTLPSMLGRETLRERRLEEIGERELRLREGQANDALHRLRMAIGLKSAVFRTDIREAEGRRAETRAWTRAQGIAKKPMKRLVMTESEAKEMEKRFEEERSNRSNAAKLKGDRAPGGPPASSSRQAAAPDSFAQWVRTLPDVMQRYRPLHKDDLSATTHLVDNSERNSRHKVLSWIWSVDVRLDTENSDWLVEIHRVNWLHERARSDRWNEQVVLVGEEIIRENRPDAWAL